MHILVADDHRLFLEMCEAYVTRKRPDIQITTAKDLQTAIDAAANHDDLDLAVMDLCMPGMHGADGVAKFKQQFPNLPLAIMSGVAHQSDIDQTMQAGAIGFFPKTMSAQALISAMELVYSGEIFVPVDYQPPPELHPQNRLKDINAQAHFQAEDIHLTKREKDVVAFLIEGASNQDIADALGLQLVTVKLHVRGICRKLSAKNRTQAALRAKELLKNIS